MIDAHHQFKAATGFLGLVLTSATES